MARIDGRIAIRTYPGEHECDLNTCTEHALAEVVFEEFPMDEEPVRLKLCGQHFVAVMSGTTHEILLELCDD